MKAPSKTDHLVPVVAYMTDEEFGYEHWRAAQYASPDAKIKRPGVLLIFENDTEREDFLNKVLINVVRSH